MLLVMLMLVRSRKSNTPPGNTHEVWRRAWAYAVAMSRKPGHFAQQNALMPVDEGRCYEHVPRGRIPPVHRMS